MEIRPIFCKEIVGVISLKTGRKHQIPRYLHSREEKSPGRFFLPKVSLISILQKFSKESSERNVSSGAAAQRPALAVNVTPGWSG